MASTAGVKNYTDEFKKEMVERLIAGETPSKVSRETGVAPVSLRRWVERSQGITHSEKPQSKKLAERRPAVAIDVVDTMALKQENARLKAQLKTMRETLIVFLRLETGE